MRKLYKQVWAINVSRSAVTPSMHRSRSLKKSTRHVVVGQADFCTGRHLFLRKTARLDREIMAQIKLIRRKPQYYNAKKATAKAISVIRANSSLSSFPEGEA